MHHKTLKHPLPQSLVHIINDDTLPAQSPAHKINDKNINLILKHLPQQSIAQKINVEILKEKYKKNHSASPATYVRNQ